MRSRFSLALAVIVSFSAFTFASAWTGPTGTAPSNNTSAPINVGTTNQVKSANLGLNGLVVFGNSQLYGTGSGGNAYLNFGATAGTSGYGIFDNGGTLQFKNSGGSWQSLQSIVAGLAGGAWTQSGSTIYYNGGNVGIGTASPGYLLDVNGTSHVAGALTVSGGANVTGRLNVTGNAGDWAEVVNWGPGSVNGYGLLVGTGASDYSQFENASGYYTLLAQSSNGVNTNGNIYAAGFYYSSDERLKHDIQTYVDPLTKVLQLRPVTFKWDDQSLSTSTQIGFIAQEVQQVVPQLVTTNSATGLLSVDYAGFAPLLVGSVQQLDQKIETQQQQLDQQQSEIEALQAQVAALAKTQ